jgi:hypothetical protein
MKLLKGLAVFALGFGLGAALIPTLHDPAPFVNPTNAVTAQVIRR